MKYIKKILIIIFIIIVWVVILLNIIGRRVEPKPISPKIEPISHRAIPIDSWCQEHECKG